MNGVPSRRATALARLRAWPVGLEILAVVGLFAGWFIWSAVTAVIEQYPAGNLTDEDMFMLVRHELAMSAAAAALLALRGWPWREAGWRVTPGGLLLAVPAMFATSYAANVLIWDCVAPWMGVSPPTVDPDAPAPEVSTAMVVLFSAVNGAYEEFFLCGYLMTAMRRWGAPWAIALSGLVRVAYHVYQGPAGALSVLAFGLIATVYYWHWRQLWPVVIVHVIADVNALI